MYRNTFVSLKTVLALVANDDCDISDVRGKVWQIDSFRAFGEKVWRINT